MVMKAKGFVKNMKNEVDEVDYLYTPVGSGGFTAQDLKIHMDRRSMRNHPFYYDSDTLKQYNLRYTKTILIKRSDISMDNILGQLYRTVDNEERDNIYAGMSGKGYDLSEVPVSVIKEKDGKYRIHEGRTRISIFDVRGLRSRDNIIVDVYERIEYTISGFIQNNKHAFGVNNTYNPKGRPTEEDTISFILSILSQMEEINVDDLAKSSEARSKLRNKIEDMLVECNAKVTDTLVNRCYDEYKTKFGVSTITKAFTSSKKNTKEVALYCRKMFGIKDTNKYRHIFVSGDARNVPKSIITILSSNPLKKGEKIRVIVFTARLDIVNPVQDWLNKNIGSYKRMIKALEVFCKPTGSLSYHHPDFPYEIYGTIPQCHELQKQYPMEKFIKYKDLSEAELNKGKNKKGKY